MMDFAVYSFTVLFLIVDPIANVPLFFTILEKFDPKHRKPMIKKAVATAAVVLLLFIPLGNYLFEFLGIEMPSFKIAGGILLFIISLEMLFGMRTRTESSAEEEDETKRREDIAATPMAVPLLTGPGAITVGIMLFNSVKSSTEMAILFVNVILVFVVSYIILINSEKIFKALGNVGTRVIVRIMGLLLTAIAVQFIITGIREALAAV